MADPAPPSKSLLREDLSKEYYALLNVVSNYDGWLLVVKGWSVTLSLAALGLAFQQRHYALFLLAAVTGAAFWSLDGLMKGYQYRYYIRMREIEYTSYLINRVRLGGEYGSEEISAPRIDMTWDFKGYPIDQHGRPLPRRKQSWWRRVIMRSGERKPYYDWRAEEPYRREPEKIYRDLRNRFRWANVAIPHVLAVVLGLLLFATAVVINASGLAHLHL